MSHMQYLQNCVFFCFYCTLQHILHTCCGRMLPLVTVPIQLPSRLCSPVLKKSAFCTCTYPTTLETARTSYLHTCISGIPVLADALADVRSVGLPEVAVAGLDCTPALAFCTYICTVYKNFNYSLRNGQGVF